jgi:autotransporter translocation and assembly factor TamB
VLSLLANGYVVDTDVTVGVRGPARQPQLVLRSNPPLAEYQILTLLVTGRANALDDSNGDVRREAAQLVPKRHGRQPSCVHRRGRVVRWRKD